MVKEISVAEAKRNFSELMARVVFGGDEYIIKKRGKAMVALIRPEYVKLIHALETKQKTKGLLGMVGKFDDSEDYIKEVDAVYGSRKAMKDRKVSP